jgi:hypothetical protein
MGTKLRYAVRFTAMQNAEYQRIKLRFVGNFRVSEKAHELCREKCAKTYKNAGYGDKEKVPKSLDFRTLLHFALMFCGMDGTVECFSYFPIVFNDY